MNRWTVGSSPWGDLPVTHHPDLLLMTAAHAPRTSLGCLLAWLLTPAASLAQAPPPPPPPPVDEPASAPADPYAEDPYADPSGQTAPAATTDPALTDQPPAADAPPADPYADPYATPEAGDDFAASAPDASASEGEAHDDTEQQRHYRKASLRRQSSLTGSTGLLRVREAGSSAPGTFRFSVVNGLNGMTGFLCNDSTPCADRVSGQPVTGDSSQRSDMRASLTVTPLPFLEAYAGIRNVTTSSSLGFPRLVSILGDWNLGVKGFLPDKPDRIFSFGGEVDLLLLNGSGGVGLSGAATGFSIRGLGSADFTRTKSELPLRVHGNLAYRIDNSAAVVSGIETTPPPGGRGEPIERTERYGLDLSRVDSFEVGIGAEYINKWVRPFVEWTIDVPMNRQGYVCNIAGAASRGDLCLGVASGFETSPSRLSLGARGFPWQESGLAVTFAVDIGTGATSRFMEEVRPEAPYSIWLGLAYGVDVFPLPEVRVVETAPEDAPQAMRRYATGKVVDEKSGEPVPDALLRYADSARTGLIASAAGTFLTQDLPPGTYSLKVHAHEFEDATCDFVVPDSAPLGTSPTAPADPAMAPEAADEAGGGTEGEAGALAEATPPDAPYLDEEGNLMVPVTCTIKALPQVATITGVLVDPTSGAAVQDATVTITDKLGRSLKLAVDAQGAFQFRNVPFGLATVAVRAPGYLTTVRDFQVASREEITANLEMHAVPDKPGVKVTAKELVVSRPIAFLAARPDVARESMLVIEELAYVLAEHPEISRAEIQVHTDDSGSPTDQRRISQERAAKIVDLLGQLGVEKSRLVAKGYGPDQPLVPNVSEANRARNNRVQIIILEKQ